MARLSTWVSICYASSFCSCSEKKWIVPIVLLLYFIIDVNHIIIQKESRKTLEIQSRDNLSELAVS